MASKPVPIKSPMKGVAKSNAWQEHNPEFAMDALNVLPFDTAGRRRVAQRPGSSRLWSAAIGSSNAVRLLAHTTTLIDSSSASHSEVLLNETFSQANGTLLHNVGGAGTTWKSGTGSNSTPNSPDANAVTVTGGKATKTTASNTGGSLYVPTLGIGTAYTLKGRVTGFNSADLTGTVYLLARQAAPATNSVGIGVGLETDRIFLFHKDGLGNVTVDASTVVALSSVTEYDLELKIVGNAVTGLIDGVSKVTATITNDAAQTGVGFSIAAGNFNDFRVYIPPTLAAYRQTDVLAVSNGNIYVGTIDETAPATAGSTQLTATVRPQVAISQGFAYFVDGTNIRKLNVATRAMVAYAATAGTAPTGCTLAAMYRDRLVLAAPLTAPQNFFFSRVGTHTDWDYAAADTDPARAFAGNASEAGRIGDPILALIPLTADAMLIGGDHSMYVVRGDPAQGGSIDLLSDSVGILGPNAWTKDPDGNVYFLGTGGLFKMAPNGSVPENLSSQKWNEFFKDIDRSSNFITLAWDRDRQGAFVFITPASSGTATHLWFDLAERSFWPLNFPDSYGPLSATVYDGDGGLDRVTLFGTRDGFVRKFGETDYNDDGTAVTSYLYLGPFRQSDVTEAVLEWVDLILAEAVGVWSGTQTNVTVTIQSGQTVEQAFSNPRYTRSKTFTSHRRQTKWMNRIRGNVFVLKFANSTLDKTWGLESGLMMFMPGGMVRRA